MIKQLDDLTKNTCEINTIVFVDAAVADYQSLINRLDANIQPIVLDPNQDGVLQMTAILQQYHNIAAIHLVSHGAAGRLRLGNSELNLVTLSRYASALKRWSTALTTDGAILLYGCQVAAGEQGRALITQLHQLTGAKLAASATPTGNAALGGDWYLEVRLGSITPTIAFSAAVREAYASVLIIDSDDFNSSSLRPIWTFINPQNDASYQLVGAGSGNAYLELVVPGGLAHNPFPNNNQSVRVVQAVDNSDFAAEVKFGSEPTQAIQMQGILVEQDANNWLRFDVYHNGRDLRLYAATITNGTSNTRLNTRISSGAATYLRLQRQGDQWTLQYSATGTSWTTAASFTQALNVNKAGTYAGNQGSNSPAYTAQVDYFFNTASPIVPEDGAASPTNQPPVANNDAATLTSGNTVTLNVLNNDSDSDGTIDPTTVTIVNSPSNGSVVVNNNGTIAYTHNGSSASSDNFSYTVQDDDGATSNPATVALTLNSGGNSGGPTINIWYGNTQPFGQIGQPQPWVNILGNVSDSNGIASLSYALNGGASRALSIGPDQRRLAKPGDFNVDIATSALMDNPNDNAATHNTLVITATDTLGNVSNQTVTVAYTAGQTWPQTYSIDWSSVSNIQTVAQVIDGKWAIGGDRVTIVEPDYDRLIGLGDVGWSDYEITAPITVNTLPRQGGFGFLMRWQGHTDNPVSGQPKSGFLPNGAISWWTYKPNQTSPFSGPEIYGSPKTRGADRGAPEVGKTYMFKARVETIDAGGGFYSLKIWDAGQPEPAQWDVQQQQSTSNELRNGSVLLISHQFGVSYGDIQITPISGQAATQDALLATAAVGELDDLTRSQEAVGSTASTDLEPVSAAGLGGNDLSLAGSTPASSPIADSGVNGLPAVMQTGWMEASSLV